MTFFFLLLCSTATRAGAVKEDNTIQQQATKRNKKKEFSSSSTCIQSNPLQLDQRSLQGGGFEFISPPRANRQDIERTINHTDVEFLLSQTSIEGVSNGWVGGLEQIVFFFFCVCVCVSVPGKTEFQVAAPFFFRAQMTVEPMEVIREEPPAIWSHLEHQLFPLIICRSIKRGGRGGGEGAGQQHLQTNSRSNFIFNEWRRDARGSARPSKTKMYRSGVSAPADEGGSKDEKMAEGGRGGEAKEMINTIPLTCNELMTKQKKKVVVEGGVAVSGQLRPPPLG